MADLNVNRRDVLALTGAGAVGLSVASSGAAAAMPGAVLPAGTTSAAGKRPNIVLFVPDEMRADALACYGNPVTRTPNFDRLAVEGTRFENCHVQFPVCGASRCSFLTGWPTSVRGHRSLTYFLRPQEPNLFRYLKESGYDVVWLGKNDAFAPDTFYPSLTTWTEGRREARPDWKSTTQTPGITAMLLGAFGDRRETNDYFLVQQAIKLLERRETDRPVCIFLALYNPHPPYTIPADFYDMYRPSDLPPPVPPGAGRRPNFHAAIRQSFGLDKLGEATFRKVRAVYYGQVSYSDWLLGELLEAMDRSGRNNDTALFAFSDHGDYAGDYGLIEKWPSGLEDCLTQVPMVVRLPGGARGHVSPGMIEVFDMMQTCLDLAGVQARHTHFARSLLPQLGGGAGDPQRAAFTEGGYNIYEPQAFEPVLQGIYEPKTRLQHDRPETVSRAASVRTRTHKLILRPNGQSELYDCRSDPHLVRNLYGQFSAATVQQALQSRLTDWYINTTGIAPMDKDPRGLPPCDPLPQFRPDPAKLLDH
jgi:arylsulfatase A-like enzyme